MKEQWENDAGIMERIRRIFAERDEEYRQKEGLYRERKESLCRQEMACEERKKQLSLREETIIGKEKEYQEREATLKEKEEALEQERRTLETEREQNGRERDEAMLQVSLLKEEARNEVLKAQRMTEEYEKRLTLLGEGSFRERSESREEELESLQERLQTFQEEIETLEKENERIRTEKEQLQKEKGELFRKLMKMGTGPVPEPVAEEKELSEREEVTEKLHQSEAVTESEPVSVELENGWEPEEGLTAETFSAYLKEIGIPYELLHNREGELIRLTLHSLSVVVRFKDPSCFAIHKKVRHDRRVKQMVERINILGSPVEALYDKKEQEVILMGTFDSRESPSRAFLKIEETMKAYFEV